MTVVAGQLVPVPGMGWVCGILSNVFGPALSEKRPLAFALLCFASFLACEMVRFPPFSLCSVWNEWTERLAFEVDDTWLCFSGGKDRRWDSV